MFVQAEEPSAVTAFPTPVEESEEVPFAVAAHAVSAELPVPAPVADRGVGLPAFELPIGSLQDIAKSAGLEWVNSDVEKIRAVQAALQSQPEPARVPRERKPVARVDEGPLVLVETRKDLSQYKLPFETAPQESPSRE